MLPLNGSKITKWWSTLQPSSSFVKLLDVQIDDQINFNLYISNICRSPANQLKAETISCFWWKEDPDK